MLVINNLCKSFEKRRILNNINLSVSAGEIAVLLGSSGVGKSTLLRVLNNLETADSGTITLDGKTLDLKTVNTSHTVGMVFQHFNLFDHRWVIGPGEFHSGEFTEDEIEDILALMANNKYPEAYFLVTESQLNYIEVYNVTPDGAVIRLFQELFATNQVEIVEANPDAILFKYIGEGGE